MAFKFIQQLMNVKVVKTVNKENEGATIQKQQRRNEGTEWVHQPFVWQEATLWCDVYRVCTEYRRYKIVLN